MTPLVLIPGMMCDARMWGGLPALLHPRTVGHVLPTDADTIAGTAPPSLATSPDPLCPGGPVDGRHRRDGGAAPSPRPGRAPGPAGHQPPRRNAEVQASRAPQIARALSGDLAGVLRDEMKPNYLCPGPDTRQYPRSVHGYGAGPWSRSFRPPIPLLCGIARIRQATLAAFKGPALVLMGEDDRLCPRDRHDLMHALMPQSQLAIIKGAGHLPTLEQPAQTTAELLRWLAPARKDRPMITDLHAHFAAGGKAVNGWCAIPSRRHRRNHGPSGL